MCSHVNPRYLGYGPLELDVGYSQLAYNPGNARHPLFWDSNGDGRYTTVVDPATGCWTPDLDLNGTLKLDEDFPLRMDGAQQSYSRTATQALANQSTFGGSCLADVPTMADDNVFWGLREALLSIVDYHSLVAPDKSHIRQAFDGCDRAGHWVKINPLTCGTTAGPPRTRTSTSFLRFYRLFI